MSYVTIYLVNEEGRPDKQIEVRNAMAGAIVIWRKLYEKYVPGGDYIKDQMLGAGGDRRLWDLWKDPQLSENEALCMLFTFDQSFLRVENFEAMTTALREFFETYCEGIHPTIPGIADALEKYGSEPGIIGACFQQTSVSESPWFSPQTCPTCGQERDDEDYVAHNFLKDEGHVDIFNSLVHRKVAQQ